MSNARTFFLALILLFASPLMLADELGPGNPDQQNMMTTTSPGDATTNDELGPGNEADGEQSVMPWWWEFLFPGLKF